MRVRYLQAPLGFGKLQKYDQTPGSRPLPYLPPLLPRGTTWADIAADPEIPIFITEGEKKSAKLCVEGHPTIGLGGVWNFTSKKTGEMLLDELEVIDWKGRSVLIIFDSDVLTNKGVKQAETRLAKLLEARGAFVSLYRFPLESDEKMGVDDFIVAHGIEAFRAGIANAQSTGLDADTIHALNAEFVLVRHPLIVRSQESNGSAGASWRVQDFLHYTANRKVEGTTAKGSPTELHGGKAWLESVHRNEVEGFVNEPGESFPILIREDGSRFFNTWRGWGVEPSSKGSIVPWRRLIDGLFGREPNAARYVEQWLAYPLQNPGAKLYQSIFVWSVAQGVGKSAVGIIMAKIHGAGGKLLAEGVFDARFTDFLDGTTFICADDLPSDHPIQLRGKLKTLITSEELHVDRKYQPSYTTSNRANFLFTANSIEALPVDSSENRRVFIVQGPSTRPYPETWFTGVFDRWIRSVGPARVFYHLLHDVDCSDFSPHGDAPETQSRRDAAGIASNPIQAWLREVKRDLPAFAHECGFSKAAGELFTVDCLTARYNLATESHASPTSKRAMGRALFNIGAAHLGQIRASDGTQPTLWALGHVERWRKKSQSELTTAWLGRNPTADIRS